jgi:F-type H+-transporting ATPase subunit epsilon
MSISLSVVTPEGEAFQGEADAVVLPGAEGEFGVLPGHEPFLTALRIGTVTIRQSGGEELTAAVSQGFAEVHEDGLSVMVGSCEFAHDIDRSRAEVAAERAKQQLEQMRGTEEGEAAYQEYQDAYSRAVARVAASEKATH